VEIADRLTEERGYGERCTFTTGDFQTVDLGLCADAIVAVESFAHSADADAFLANAARHLREGGRLFVADDFLATEESTMDARSRRLVGRFRAGWRVPSVDTAERLVTGADRHGLREDRTVDLTSFTRPGSRLRDHLTAAVGPLLSGLHLERYPFCGNLSGGHALQVGMREGFLRYKVVVLRKEADSIAAPG
jgi:cyclopropane fatty-acyl-phospholipid synthase-like methyltransferase